MKTLKSILLGSGAALVATSATAADLPVVEPVDYVQICDAYDDGFFYIPGTNTCLEISGFVRFEARFNGDDAPGNAYAGGPFALLAPSQRVLVNPVTGLPVVFSGDSDNFNFGARARLNFDARTETEMGTLRSFIQFDAGTTFSVSSLDDVDVDLAFIEFDLGGGTLQAGLAASIAGVAGPTVFGDATAFESGGGEAVQLAYSFDLGVAQAAIAVRDGTPDFGTVLYGGLAAPFVGGIFTSQTALSQDLPILEAALDFDLGPIGIDTGFALGQVEARFNGFDAVTGTYYNREFEELGYAAAISATASLGVLNLRAGASYSHGLSDYGFDGANVSGIVGTPFGAAPINTAGAVAALDFDLVDAYSFYGQIGANVGAFAVNLVGTYGQAEYPLYQTAAVNGGDTVEAYTIALNASVQPVEGLTILGEVFYSDIDADANIAAANPINAALLNVDGSYDADQFGALFRIQRSF